MTGTKFVDFLNYAKTILITGGETNRDVTLRQVCDLIISQPESVTPYQMARLADMAAEVANRNAHRQENYVRYRKYGGDEE